MKMRRHLSLILVLLLIVTVLPLSAAAKKGVTIQGYQSAFHIQQADGSFMSQYVFPDHTQVFTMYGEIIQSSNGTYKVGDAVYAVVGAPGKEYLRHFHEFEFVSNRNGHGQMCSCGLPHGFVSHDDPKTAVDGKCSCGYTYYTNAQATVIWMRNVVLSPRFSKDKYEYTGKVYADVDEISLVTVKLFDEKATLEQPKDFKLKDGMNTFQFTITAEDGKTTQTYTFNIEK